MEYISGKSTAIKIIDEGYTVIAIIVKDKAGNLSTPITVKLKKDSEAPLEFIPRVANEKAKGFDVNAGTVDEISGIAEYRYYVGGELKGITSEERLEITGLDIDKTYAVYVEAVDNAGNVKKSTSITGTTKGDLLSPNIEVTSGTLGNNDYYTSNLTVTINDRAGEDTTSAKKIIYKVNNGEEQIIDGRTVEYPITEDGTYEIVAYVADEAGNRSESNTKVIKKDATPPIKPTITPNGTLGDNNYYTSNINLMIASSGCIQIKYKINSGAEGTINGETGEVGNAIIIDGTYTVTAYAIDEAGNRSEESTITLYKDETAPNTASLSVIENANANETKQTIITVNAVGADSTSGINRYEFFYKTSNDTAYTYAGRKETSSGTCTYKYEKLKTETQYEFLVNVYDNAGNSKSGTVSQTTEGIVIGNYVNYKPNKGTYSKIGEEYTGSTLNTNNFTTQDFGWRIWKIDKENDELLLIPHGATTSGGKDNKGNIVFSGATRI